MEATGHPSQAESTTKHVKNYIYSTTDQIGQGLSSRVFKGKNMISGEFVALKVIDLKSINTEVEKLLLRNQLKALSLLRLLKHENVIDTIEICQTANNIYIVTEYCNEGNLLEAVNSKGQFGESEAIRIIKQMAQGLNHIFSNKIVHRDLKTANILLKDGKVKIADFGFCEFAHDTLGKQFPYNVGSPLYMSPEAYNRSFYSPKSDIWALGIILCEMLIGAKPFDGMNYQTMIKKIASGQIYNMLSVSGFTKMLLSRMLSIDINRRFGINQLIEILGHHTQIPRVVSQRLLPTHISSIRMDSTNIAMPKHGDIHNKEENGLSDTTKRHINVTPIPVSQSKHQYQIPPKSSISGLKNTDKIQFKKIPIAKSPQINQIHYSPYLKKQQNSRLHGILSFEKKQTVLSVDSQEKDKDQIIGRIPLVVSLDSNLSVSQQIPEQSSDKLLVPKFLYRLHKLFKDSTLQNPHSKRLQILTLKHLEASLKSPQIISYFNSKNNNETCIYKKLVQKTQSYVSKLSTKQYYQDEYFCHIIDNASNFSGPQWILYTQFWTKKYLQDLNKSIESNTKATLGNFADYNVQHQAASYLYCLKYYGLLESMENRLKNGSINAELTKLFENNSTISPQAFKTMCSEAKCLVH